VAVTPEERSRVELERIAEQQAALRRIATLVAEGVTGDELAAAVTTEIGAFFRSQRANVLRWDGDTLRVIGEWNAEKPNQLETGAVYSFGGDTITARVIETGAPARVNSAADLRTAFGRRRWAELGLQASIGAPLVVGGEIWGVVTASRTGFDDPFPPGAEDQLGDFATLVAQAVVNADVRLETAQLIAEQSALRRIATLVAAGRPQHEVLAAVTSEAGAVFDATSVTLIRWEGVQDEVKVVTAWTDPDSPPVAEGSLYHPNPGSATLAVLETGIATRAREWSPERGTCSVIAAPVIIKGTLLGALTAAQAGEETFPAGAEIRLRSFADLAAQSITNERAQAELRASRARIVSASDETRRRLERNLHDGAQQRLVSVSVALRLATSKLDASPEDARRILEGASEELAHALEELRDLARGLHPALLVERGLAPALEALASRAPLPVTVTNEIAERLPTPVEAALYYVVAEALTNVAKHARASVVSVNASSADGVARVEVADDGVGGASVTTGSGIRGLVDRVEALGGALEVDSAPNAGTRVRAEIPLAGVDADL